MLASEHMTDLRRSPLHERHVALGAKMADFGGWEMPIEYPGGGVVKEHTAVREAVGVFDVSHLGKAEVRGPGAAEFVNATLSNDLGRIGPGKAQYTLCCDDSSGGVVDDLIAYYAADDDVFLIPNAANTAEVVRRLQAAAPPGIQVRDLHESFGVLAVQGPRSDEVLERLGLPTRGALDYMAFARTTWQGSPLTVCRTGYTGERGYELVPPWADAPALWDAILAAGEPAGIRPCGLGARDTLRTEMGYPLHGQDLSLSITPVQARVGWAVGWKKPQFWGRAALLAEKEAGARRLLWGLLGLERAIPRPHMAVSGSAGESVGEVTSGTFSPTKKLGIGLALLDRSVSDGDEVVVDVRGRPARFRVVKPPFVEASTSG
jgi:aminomethyltransferase